MLKAKLFYLLNEAGRKDSILNGGDGKEFQIIETDVTAEILELATVRPNGDILLPIGCGIDYKCELDGNLKPVQDYKVGTESFSNKPYISEIKSNEYFDKVKTVSELLEYEHLRLSRIESTRKKSRRIAQN